MAGKKEQARRIGAKKPPSRRLLLANALVLTVMLGSAFAVISSSHACRQLYAQLQVLEAAQWHLQEEYSRLMLEQSTWASHYRVEKVAGAELGMKPPAIDHLVVVTP